MSDLISIDQIDLSPIRGKTYFDLHRDWREEVIYFLMIDRFHDSTPRRPLLQSSRSQGYATPGSFYGGTIRGITDHLDYIAELGCTAIWLSPIFENNRDSYHGYDINNYLDVDPHFGSKQDLIDLVDAAHHFTLDAQPYPMRVILDVVINHSGDNWSYPNDAVYMFDNDRRFEFGAWRRPDRPIPIELRNEELYHRRGQVSHYDTYPETQDGDICNLKDYANDDDEVGATLIKILIKSHCYWIREADVDGFRVDAVKHMNPVACAAFCSAVREYAYTLGKRQFFLFGEVAAPSDNLYNRYLGPNTSITDAGDTIFFGLDSVLDFRLAEGIYGDESNAPLRDVLKGLKGPTTLFNRLGAQRENALSGAELGRYLVTFLDNHDSFWQPSGRYAHGSTDEQVIGAVGFLLCSLGTPCLYYGTEQGLAGYGGDNQVREALFDRAPGGRNALNPESNIYHGIKRIACVRHSLTPLRFGRMYYRQISVDGVRFGLPYGSTYTLAFSRMLYGSPEVLVAYNVSDGNRSDGIVVDAEQHADGSAIAYAYGGTGTVPVQTAPDGTRFVRVPLGPNGFAILS